MMIHGQNLSTNTENENENENEPLLPENNRYPAKNTTKPYTKLVVLLYLLILIVDFGGLLQIAPMTQIFETVICRKFYARYPANQGIEEINHSCKVQEVQSELALLKGVQSFLSILPNLLLTIPYGVLVNIYGRQLSLCLAMLGLCLQLTWIILISWFSDVFSLRLIWLSSAFHIIGGGPSVALSIVYILVADKVPHSYRAQVFFGLDAARLLAVAVGTATSSVLMKRGPWIPMFFALLITYVGSSFALFIPTGGPGSSLMSNSRHNSLEDTNASDVVSTTIFSSALETKYVLFKDDLYRFKKSLSINSLARKILAMSLVSTLTSSSSSIILIYASKRFDWSFAKANLLTTLRASVNLIVILLLIPLVGFWLIVRCKVSHRERETYLARGSALVILLGLSIVAIAPTPTLLITGVVVSSLGFGADALLRSILTSVIPSHEIGTFYTSMTLLQNLGESAGGLLYSTLFSVALNLQGFWLGLPFIISAILSVLSLVMVSDARLSHDKSEDQED
ncbi:putative mfs multidrug protein [Botrytis fragariae]|uniref:Putative mfs multidrug protein n=1 Tax=Botrytis fragariae TaxID=1964551 RepID=A0A8H6ASV2_9HELO|nr:putative mfs multidrug protein [Botrytis fragariae]KAF5872750.1 putative mfs multidrug protein [Botrytis fragariae]